MNGISLAEVSSESGVQHTLDGGGDEYAFCMNGTAAVTDILQFNFSEYDYPGDGGGPWPPPLGIISALKITFCIINMIVSILGNTAVIIAVYHNPALRSTINFYLVGISLINFQVLKLNAITKHPSCNHAK